ncbi:hypothetical protein [Aquiflexum balticum]|nr:hypothetical protein [Aquiflexum balticum]
MKKGAMSQRLALGTAYKIRALESGYKLCLVPSLPVGRQGR